MILLGLYGVDFSLPPTARALSRLTPAAGCSQAGRLMPYETRSRQAGATDGGPVALEEEAVAAAKPSAARRSSERNLREAHKVAPDQQPASGGEGPELGGAEEEVTDPHCAPSGKPSINLRPRAASSAARDRGRAASAPPASAASRASDGCISAGRKRPRSTPPQAEPAVDLETEAADDVLARDERVGDHDRWDGHIDEDAWEVERVLKRRRRLGVTEYLVRWAGWDEKHNSWVPEDDISEELLEDLDLSEAHAARKRRKPAGLCLRSDKCSMPAGHAGWCDKRFAAAGKALGQEPDECDEDEAVATEPVADVVARVQAAARARRPPLPLEPADPRPDKVLIRQLFGFLKPRYATDEGSNPTPRPCATHAFELRLGTQLGLFERGARNAAALEST